MNTKITALSLVSLLVMAPLLTHAADKSAAPPTAIPGVNQSSNTESNDEKANKKGEEASGSNSGAEPHETAKDAATSSDSKDIEKKPNQ
jgi:hypothetical protein